MWNQESKDYRTNATVRTDAAPTPERRPGDAKDVRVATFGGSVLVKGEVTGSEDLTVDGRVEGRIELPDHQLTVGPNAMLQANIHAKIVTIFGSVVGTITARDKVEVRRGGSVEGTVSCARIAIQDGAHFCGKVDMKGERRPANDADSKTAMLALAPVA